MRLQRALEGRLRGGVQSPQIRKFGGHGETGLAKEGFFLGLSGRISFLSEIKGEGRAGDPLARSRLARRRQGSKGFEIQP